MRESDGNSTHTRLKEGEGLVGRLLMVDARSMRFETLNYAWDESNPLSGTSPTIRDLSIQNHRERTSLPGSSEVEPVIIVLLGV